MPGAVGTSMAVLPGIKIPSGWGLLYVEENLTSVMVKEHEQTVVYVCQKIETA